MDYNYNVLKQQQYQTDVSGFGNNLRIKYPKVWERVKKNGNQTFGYTR